MSDQKPIETRFMKSEEGKGTVLEGCGGTSTCQPSEFRAADLMVLDCPPAPFSRVILRVLVVFSLVAICWGIFARIDIVVSAAGVVIPKGKVKIVQPHDSGVVIAIHVRDGQKVSKGEPLISMDNRDHLEDIKRLSRDLILAELDIQRIDAELKGDVQLFAPPAEADSESLQLQKRLLEKSIGVQQELCITLDKEIQRCRAEIESIESNVDRLEASLPLTRQMFEQKRVLAEKKLIPNTDLLQARIEMNDVVHNLQTAKKQLLEAGVRLEQAEEEKRLAETEYHRDLLQQLAEAENKREQLLYQLAKVENKETDFELVAPADGIVQQLAVNTVGGVVTAAQPLLVIVPTGCGLEVEAKVLNKDIGFVATDQDVSIKVAAYPFTRYGGLEGKIEWVAGDAVMDDEMGPSYPIRVSIDEYVLPRVINGRQGVIAPGMTVTADVKVGQRRVIEYFLGPLLRYKDESLREI